MSRMSAFDLAALNFPYGIRMLSMMGSASLRISSS